MVRKTASAELPLLFCFWRIFTSLWAVGKLGAVPARMSTQGLLANPDCSPTHLPPREVAIKRVWRPFDQLLKAITLFSVAAIHARLMKRFRRYMAFRILAGTRSQTYPHVSLEYRLVRLSGDAAPCVRLGLVSVSRCVRYLVPCTRSFFRLLKKLSVGALSQLRLHRPVISTSAYRVHSVGIRLRSRARSDARRASRRARSRSWAQRICKTRAG